MEKIKEIAGLAAITVLFSLLTWALVASYLEDYNLLSSESATVTVTEKTGAKGLFTLPSYYVRVELPNGEESEYLNRISKKQMLELERGDSLSGYSEGPSNFSTIYDIVSDSTFYLSGILILGFMAFCCLVATVLSIPALDRLEQNTSYKRYVKRERKGRNQVNKPKKEKQKETGWGIAGVTVLFFLLFTVRFLINLVRKLSPFGKTETEALIFDNYSYITYHKYEDSTYMFTVAFEDKNGHNIKVIKNVTSHTYQQFEIGDELPIAYNNANPYDVFVRTTSFNDIFQLTMTWEIFLYAALLAVSGFVGWAFYDSRLKRKLRRSPNR